MPSTVRHKDNIIKYKYDNMGNISEIRENGILTARYTYDTIGRLVREDNKHSFTTTLYTYDNNGNILFKKNHAFTLNDADYLEEMEYTVDTYKYDGDKLMSYNGEPFVYDDIGNPIKYRGKKANWSHGRRLVRYVTNDENDENDENTFTYDARGRRIGKNNISFAYDSGGNLIKQTEGTTTLEFLYDHTGVCAVVHNGSTYFYRKNTQGDIISLLDNTGEVSVYYRYNAWGVCTVLDANGVQIDDASHIGNLNPFRYRSYYYDIETKLYFLKTRYYDPEICRFITIDDISYLDPDTINGLNLYAYCVNNPVMHCDPNGTEWWKWLLGIGIVIVAVAATVLTCGAAGVAIGGTALLGSVIHGAAVGALIGAGVGIVGGAIAGGIYSAVTGADFWSSVGIGIAAGFGIGAIVGAIIGGSISYFSYHQDILVKDYISKYARDADDANNIFNSFEGKIRLKTSRGNVNAYRYYDDVDAFARGRYLTNKPTANPIDDLVLYNNKATHLARWNLPRGTQYLSGKIAGSPVGAIQYFVGDAMWLILL